MIIEQASLSTARWYDANAHQFAEALEPYTIPEFPDFINRLQPGALVIDVGSAAARDVGRFMSAGFRTVGIDLSSGLSHEARQRVPNGRFVNGSFLRAPFKPKLFDAAWSNAGFVHLESVEQVIASLCEVNRILKDDGLFYVKVKAQTGPNKFETVADKHSGGYERLFQYFAAPELIKLLRTAGFSQIEKWEQYGEAERMIGGRADVQWLYAFARK